VKLVTYKRGDGAMRAGAFIDGDTRIVDLADAHGSAFGEDHAPFLHDPAGHGARQDQRGVVRGEGLVGLGDAAVAEHRLVGAAVLAPDDEHQQPRGDPVEPVGGGEVGQVEVAPQPHERGLDDVAPARDRRQEVWFVDDEQVLVAVHDADREGDGHLVGQVAVQPHERAGDERGVGTQRPVDAGDLGVGEHLVDAFGLHARQALDQVVAHERPGAVVGGPQPDRVEPVPRGQRRAQRSPHQCASLTGPTGTLVACPDHSASPSVATAPGSSTRGAASRWCSSTGRRWI